MKEPRRRVLWCASITKKKKKRKGGRADRGVGGPAGEAEKGGADQCMTADKGSHRRHAQKIKEPEKGRKEIWGVPDATAHFFIFAPTEKLGR